MHNLFGKYFRLWNYIPWKLGSHIHMAEEIIYFSQICFNAFINCSMLSVNILGECVMFSKST